MGIKYLWAESIKDAQLLLDVWKLAGWKGYVVGRIGDKIEVRVWQ